MCVYVWCMCMCVCGYGIEGVCFCVVSAPNLFCAAFGLELKRVASRYDNPGRSSAPHPHKFFVHAMLKAIPSAFLCAQGLQLSQ